MSGLETAAMILGGIGTATSAAGTIMGADAANAASSSSRALDLIAAMRRQEALKQAADESRAVASREAFAIDRQKKDVIGKAKTIGAATGGGDDPSVINTIAGIDREGEYQKAMALYSGENRARGLEDEGRNAVIGAINNNKASEYEGAVRRRNALFSAGGTILSGASSIYDRYNPSRFRYG